METKRCTLCKEEKDTSEFYVINRKDRKKPQLFSKCKSCCSVYKSSSKEYYRDWELRKKYGITLEEYKEQSSKRNNICDICEHTVATLHVDHNHKTGKIRGYLCGSCNRALGLLKDSSEVCNKAFSYLLKHGD